MSRTDQAKAIADIKANPTRYSKSAELTNLENKIQEKVKVPLAKLINAYTKRLYDGIPAQAKEIVSREDYQTEAKAVVITTLINEFKKNTTNRLGEKTTNDIEDLMFNRGYFRMLPLQYFYAMLRDVSTTFNEIIVIEMAWLQERCP